MNYNANSKFWSLKFLFLFVLFIFFFIIFNIKNRSNEIINNFFSKKSIGDENNEKIILEKLKTILDKDEIMENEKMKYHTTFQLGGPAKYFTKPKSINKIIKIIKICKDYSIDYFILGNGSDLLVSDHGFDGLIINIHEDNFSNLKIEKLDQTNYQVIVGGGILMRTLAKKLCLMSLSGLEDIIDIPGTIGGGIIMNASAGLNKGLA